MTRPHCERMSHGPERERDRGAFLVRTLLQGLGAGESCLRDLEGASRIQSEGTQRERWFVLKSTPRSNSNGGGLKTQGL